MTSSIEWTERTLNPSTGCDRVSPGCDNCYALTLAARLKAMGQPKYQTDGNPRTSGPGFGFAMHPRVMNAALRRREPTMYFVNSMSDLFHGGATREFLAHVFAVMALTPRHTYQVLTKRPLRMRRVLGSDGQVLLEATVDEATAQALYDAPWPLPNVWLGTSVEDQERAEDRTGYLLETPAAVRFLSCEPLLGPLNLSQWLWPTPCGCRPDVEARTGELLGCDGGCGDRPQRSLLDWVIIGAESGAGARPMDPAWAQSIVDQCRAAGVPVFVKQLSGGRRANHDIDTFPPGLRVREYPQAVTA